jgi:hypothetical protein
MHHIRPYEKSVSEEFAETNRNRRRLSRSVSIVNVHLLNLHRQANGLPVVVRVHSIESIRASQKSTLGVSINNFENLQHTHVHLLAIQRRRKIISHNFEIPHTELTKVATFAL